MLEHTYGNDAIIPSRRLAIVLQVKAYTVAEVGIGGPVVADRVLFLA